MTVEKDDVGRAFLAEARVRLDESADLIRHCLWQLDDEQVWKRPGDGMNSIANLVLHLAGNLNQRFGTDIGGRPDDRDRFGEFTDRGGSPKADILRSFDASVAAAGERLNELSAESLTDLRRSKRLAGEADRSVLAIVFQALTHLAGHAQEITFMTRGLLGERYAFRNPDGVPPAMRPGRSPDS